jgi:hypothetical protein
MLYSSVTVVGYGALMGIGVLLLGIVLLGGLSRWALPSQRALDGPAV